jgi:hypothetical protein
MINEVELVILTDLKICGVLSWIANTDWSNLKFVVVIDLMTNDDSEITNISCKSANILYFCKIFQISQPFWEPKTVLKRLKGWSKVADVNDSKFVLNNKVCFIIALKTDTMVAFFVKKDKYIIWVHFY